MEDMSSFGALLFGMQYFHKIENFHDLSQFKVENSIIKSKKNEIAKNTYAKWKLIIDKNFIKNQA